MCEPKPNQQLHQNEKYIDGIAQSQIIEFSKKSRQKIESRDT